MNALADIWEFGKAHYGVFTLAAAWVVRDWSTIGGWAGLKSWLRTGSTKPKAQSPEPPAI